MTLDSNTETWVVTGASGLLGRSFVRRLAGRENVTVHALTHQTQLEAKNIAVTAIDITDRDSTMKTISTLSPTVVIHCAALADVDACEADETLAMAVNADGAANVARASASCGAKFVHISTDHLWDGRRQMIVEDEQVQPLNAYSRSKAAAESMVRDLVPDALIARTTFFGGDHGKRRSLLGVVIDSLRDKARFTGFDDVYFTPVYVGDLVRLICELVDKHASGTFHLPGRDRVSKFEFARRVAIRFGFDPALVVPVSADSILLRVRRPKDLSLSGQRAETTLGHPMPSLDAGLAEAQLP